MSNYEPDNLIIWKRQNWTRHFNLFFLSFAPSLSHIYLDLLDSTCFSSHTFTNFQPFQLNTFKVFKTVAFKRLINKSIIYDIFFVELDDPRMSADEMDLRRKENIAYEYLCHLEEAKV